MPVCLRCTWVLPQGHTHCPVCRGALATGRTCPHCGAENLPTAPECQHCRAALGPPPPVVAAKTPGVRALATFLDRFVAAVIDYMAVYMLAGPFMWIGMLPWYRDFMQAAMSPGAGPPSMGPFLEGYVKGFVMYFIAFYALDFINQGVLVGWRGQSVGKMAMRIKVVDESGDHIGWGVGIARFFARFMTGLFWFVGWLWMLWDDSRQTLHDKMLETYVVKT